MTPDVVDFPGGGEVRMSRTLVDSATADHYRSRGWWGDVTLSDLVGQHASDRPTDVAFTSDKDQVTWAQTNTAADQIAEALVAAGVRAADRVAVWLEDSPLLHLAFLGVERAGATIVGIGARAGLREVAHLLRRTGANVILTSPRVRDNLAVDMDQWFTSEGIQIRHLVIEGNGTDFEIDELTRDAARTPIAATPSDVEETKSRRIHTDDLFLINSTSGTTGLPKCVMHTQNRWHYFHQQAQANADLTPADVILAMVPAPFGFGIWTSHVSPIHLGARTVLIDRFTPDAAFRAIEREQVSVICCVSTQFIMMLSSPSLGRYDLSSLRVMFTGGEAVPYERALAFEEATGVTILQFYGSNETGLLSGTTLDDTPQRRLRTAGRIVPEMNVRLLDGDRDVTSTGRGQPACKGPATGLGYLDDDDANAELFTKDGWMRMGDICEVDEDGYLTLIGRTSDFIIRGGKNVSAVQVESDVSTHPAVAHAAAVAMPDPVFGERVCVYVELVAGTSLELDDLITHLRVRGVSKEQFPERLVVVEHLPRSSGAKIAKGALRDDIRRRLELEDTTADPVGAIHDTSSGPIPVDENEQEHMAGAE